MTIAENLAEIRQSIISAAQKCGRNPDDIQLVAVSKRFPASAVAEALDAGHTVFGENYIQEAEQKITEVGEGAVFHFIGHLQSNKAKTAAALFDVIETVDSFKLAKALNKHLQKIGRTIKILIQVNIGDDPNKAGITEDEAEQLLADIATLPNLRAVGLMTMPPFTVSAEEARVHFRALRQLSIKLKEKNLFTPDHKVELSMGMSGDYPVAIEEGATIIRIGTAIFGQRPGPEVV